MVLLDIIISPDRYIPGPTHRKAELVPRGKTQVGYKSLVVIRDKPYPMPGPKDELPA